MPIPICHPERDHYAKSLCEPCYELARPPRPNRSRISDSIKRKYGISLKALEAMYVAQQGRCAICGVPRPLRGKDCLHIDHNHNTGVVRGLLCGTCNKGIGLLRDDPFVLRAAADYLDWRSA
jgi:hypothetical protein